MAIRILHIIMAISVFFSTTGLIVIQHYCEKELKSTGLFLEAGCCQSEMDLADSCCQISIKDACCKLPIEEGGKGCCKSEAHYFFSDVTTFTIFKKNNDFEEFEELNIALNFSLFNPFQFSNLNFSFQYYQTPKITSNRTVLFQSFLC